MLYSILAQTTDILVNLPWDLVIRVVAYFWICSFLLMVTVFLTGDFSEDFPQDVDQDLF